MESDRCVALIDLLAPESETCLHGELHRYTGLSQRTSVSVDHERRDVPTYAERCILIMGCIFHGIG
jgi:hypothetical protein